MASLFDEDLNVSVQYSWNDTTLVPATSPAFLIDPLGIALIEQRKPRWIFYRDKTHIEVCRDGLKLHLSKVSKSCELFNWHVWMFKIVLKHQIDEVIAC